MLARIPTDRQQKCCVSFYRLNPIRPCSMIRVGMGRSGQSEQIKYLSLRQEREHNMYAAVVDVKEVKHYMFRGDVGVQFRVVAFVYYLGGV
jgi:hypothetical protein